jgi:hypothetical protein
MTDNNNNNNNRKKKKKQPWADGQSKALLRSGILSGEITPQMKPQEIWNLHPEVHGAWGYANWSNNLRTLRSAIERDRSRMQQDALAYGQTIAIVSALPRSNEPVWSLSAAPALLKKDVDDNKHKELKPKELWQSRQEYQEFSLEEFRPHIYQEVDCRPKREIRFQRKKSTWQYPEVHTDHPRLRNDADEDDEDAA